MFRHWTVQKCLLFIHSTHWMFESKREVYQQMGPPCKLYYKYTIQPLVTTSNISQQYYAKHLGCMQTHTLTHCHQNLCPSGKVNPFRKDIHCTMQWKCVKSYVISSKAFRYDYVLGEMRYWIMCQRFPFHIQNLKCCDFRLTGSAMLYNAF